MSIRCVDWEIGWEGVNMKVSNRFLLDFVLLPARGTETFEIEGES